VSSPANQRDVNFNSPPERNSIFTPVVITTLLLFFILKVLITALLPVISDEAYYFYWGTHPAGGYYDLPPMIGWIEAFFTRFSLQPLWLRFPSLLASLFISFGIYEWLSTVTTRKRSAWIAILYWLAPVHFLFVLATPDLPLVLFSFFSALLFYHAEVNPKQAWFKYLLAGALFGAAFLSKYYAILMIPGVLIWAISHKNWKGIFFTGLGGLPFLFQHVWWNSQNCWANFVFNLVTRQNAVDGTVFQTFGFFILYLLILSTPVFWGDFFKKFPLTVELAHDAPEAEFSSPRSKMMAEKNLRRFLLVLWAIPVLLFGISAMQGKGQGLHWCLFCTPFFFMWIGLKLPELQLQKRFQAMTALTGIFSVILLAGLFAPEFTLTQILKDKFKLDVQVGLRSEEFVKSLEPKLAGISLFAVDGYSFASTFDYDFRRFAEAHRPEITVWREGSRFGRAFDWNIRWSDYADKNILLFSHDDIWPQHWQHYFKEIHSEWIEFHGARYFLSRGIGFNYPLYRQEVLTKNRGFYPPFLPEYLPQKCSVSQE
jgi:hypothetical protein